MDFQNLSFLSLESVHPVKNLYPTTGLQPVQTLPVDRPQLNPVPTGLDKLCPTNCSEA
jgi:hypothetical protein